MKFRPFKNIGPSRKSGPGTFCLLCSPPLVRVAFTLILYFWNPQFCFSKPRREISERFGNAINAFEFRKWNIFFINRECTQQNSTLSQKIFSFFKAKFPKGGGESEAIEQKKNEVPRTKIRFCRTIWRSRQINLIEIWIIARKNEF